MNIPITKPYFGEEEVQAVSDVLKSGWVVQGPKVAEFEGLFARFQQAKFAVATNSATTALHLGLMALGIKEGDEVIVPAFTFPATANVVLYVGARPVFVDIDLETFNINVNQIEQTITQRTKAIIPVHLFGLPADMEPLMEIARKYGLKVLEDAACAHGAECNGKKVGTIGDAGVFSFHPRKPITTGEGGILTTNDPEIAEKVRIMRSHGESVSDESRHKSNGIIYPDYIMLGFNYRMTDLQGAVGVEQIKKLPWIIERKQRLAKLYDDMLGGLEKEGLIRLPKVPDGFFHAYQSYVILLTEKVRRSANEISNELQAKGIATRKGTYGVPFTRFYKENFGFKNNEFPVTKIAEERSLALPLYPQMTDEEQDYVVNQLAVVGAQLGLGG